VLTAAEVQIGIDNTGAAVEIGELNPWERNPRVNDIASKKLAQYIQKDGWGAPIVAQKSTGRIIAGHTRWKAAHILGLERVPVHFLDVDDRQADRLALADNKLAEIADWHLPSLTAILEEHGLEDAGLMGWDTTELEKMAAEIPDFGPLDDEPKDPKFEVIVSCDSETHMQQVAKTCADHGWKWKPRR